MAQGALSNQEILRYGRQLILPEWGVEGVSVFAFLFMWLVSCIPTSGQARLKSSSVLVVGVGGLGCPAALYLAAAGVGVLGLLDYDVVELSNLHRQVLHSEEGSGGSKVQSGLQSINRYANRSVLLLYYASLVQSSINSMVKCRTHQVLLCKDNAMDIISG